MPGALPTYAVVTPVRDEADHFARTAESIVAQTHRPLRSGWSSTTARPTARARSPSGYARRARLDRGHLRPSRSTSARAGAPIVRAFQRGCDTLARARPTSSSSSTATCSCRRTTSSGSPATFARDPRAGIVGGVALIPEGGSWVPERGNLRNVNGVAKAYRVACLEEIGGLRPSMGWDGIDEYGARARGWNVRVLTELTMLHYRPRGSKQKALRARWEEGRGNAYMGYLPSWLLVRAAYRSLVERPCDHRRPRAARRLRVGAHPAARRRSTTPRRAPSCAPSSERGSRASSAAGATPALDRAGRCGPGVLGDRDATSS